MITSVQSYEVWSSVLGNILTEIDPNGDKLETRVFAGGTVIAKQRYGSSVIWMTADPVTGTGGILTGVSQWAEEQEPLGQGVLSALNNNTVPMGGKISGGGGQIPAMNLANWIRSTLCAPRR